MRRRDERAMWRRVGLALGLALAGALMVATPALAHGVWEGDPAHLVEDLLMSFGLPLAVLLLGALGGVVLSTVLGRGDEADAAEEPSPPDDRADVTQADTHPS